MKLRLYPDDILRKKAAEASDEEAAELFPRLITSMYNYSGIGLAAPQVGIDRQVAVVSETADESLDKPLLLLNPRIIESSGSFSIEEGCLSVAGVTAPVPRSASIKVETGPGSDRQVIEAGGLLSVVIQHEIDHLNGILFPDRLSSHKRIWYLLKAARKKRGSER